MKAGCDAAALAAALSSIADQNNDAHFEIAEGSIVLEASSMGQASILKLVVAADTEGVGTADFMLQRVEPVMRKAKGKATVTVGSAEIAFITPAFTVSTRLLEIAEQKRMRHRELPHQAEAVVDAAVFEDAVVRASKADGTLAIRLSGGNCTVRAGDATTSVQAVVEGKGKGVAQARFNARLLDPFLSVADGDIMVRLSSDAPLQMHSSGNPSAWLLVAPMAGVE
jgi:hypothetical protein